MQRSSTSIIPCVTTGLSIDNGTLMSLGRLNTTNIPSKTSCAQCVLTNTFSLLKFFSTWIPSSNVMCNSQICASDSVICDSFFQRSFILQQCSKQSMYKEIGHLGDFVSSSKNLKPTNERSESKNRKRSFQHSKSTKRDECWKREEFLKKIYAKGTPSSF